MDILISSETPDFFKDISRFGNNREFIESIVEEVVRVMDATRASIFLINTETISFSTFIIKVEETLPHFYVNLYTYIRYKFVEISSSKISRVYFPK